MFHLTPEVGHARLKVLPDLRESKGIADAGHLSELISQQYQVRERREARPVRA